MGWLISIALLLFGLYTSENDLMRSAFIIAPGLYAIAGAVSYIGNKIAEKKAE